VRLLRTLRGRLIAAMLLILVVAMGVSALLDKAAEGRKPHAVAAQGNGALEDEATQDALVLAGFTVPALALIWLVSSWSLRPLARVSQEARRVGPHAPAARLSAAGLPAEILPLVDAVNGALDRMADAFAAERRFTENAAHELRTPLAVLGLRLQRARQGECDWPSIDRDLAQMNRLVGQLLDLARKENAGRGGPDAARPVVNLSRLAREASAMILPMAEAQGRSLAVSLPDTLPVRGDCDDLRDAIRNLLENAVQHGSGTIRLGAQRTATTITLQISDEGPGIPPGQEEAVFNRFHKDASSAGTGLGLAIVREVIRSHGGQVSVRPGAGCVVEVGLVAAGSQPSALSHQSPDHSDD
jgi:two-component system sensor histidine kinase QseC